MRKTVFVAGFLLVLVLQSKAQFIDSALAAVPAHWPAEKLYIHYDKEYYVAGETIWFKAYFYLNGKPSGLSRNFYVQFSDPQGRLVATQKYPVLGAVAKGHIDLPDSLPQGDYYVRAFTPGMLNGEEDFIYKKNIYVFRNVPLTQAGAAPAPPTVSLQFFPESGQLVDGILSVVGFKAADQWGYPVAVNGLIRTEDGTTIAGFKSYHDGIGKVQFRPQAEKKYIAEVETEAGKRTYRLPDVQVSGISLKVQDEKGGKKFQLSRSEKDKTLFDPLLIVAVINNHKVYETEIAFEDYPSVIGHLITDSLPSGILRFTVFNRDRIPLAERICFVDNGEYRAGAELTVEKPGFEKRAENIVTLTFPAAIQRSCSVSVTDYQEKSFQDEDHIHSRFLLTADLKGYIHNPAWYFTAGSDSAKQAMDNLMLTHGWSRYNWQKIRAGEWPVKKFTDRHYISISGIMADPRSHAPFTDGKLNTYLEAEDSSTQHYDLVPDAQGRFRLDSLIFLGKAKWFYVYTDRKEKPQPVEIIPDENTDGKNVPPPPAGFTTGLVRRGFHLPDNREQVTRRAGYVQSRLDQVKELENVNVESRSNKKPIDIVNEKYTTGVFKPMGKVNLDNINDPANDKTMTVVDLIRMRIQQVEIQGGRFVNRKNMSLMSGQKWPVGLFLNEQPTEMTLLRTIRVRDVALVKFFEAGFVGVGSSWPGGAISVYTRERDSNEEKPEKLDFISYQGYSVVKEFYQPDYSDPGRKHPATDTRTTLYWNPDLATDEESASVKLQFYNNDFSKKFRVVMEGFDANGKLIHVEKIIGE